MTFIIKTCYLDTVQEQLASMQEKGWEYHDIKIVHAGNASTTQVILIMKMKRLK